MTSLAFVAADVLQTTLYQVQDHLEFKEERKVDVGPFTIKVPVKGYSDCIKGNVLTLFVKVGDATFFVAVEQKRAVMFLLNKPMEAFGHLDPERKVPLEGVREHIMSKFVYTDTTRQWKAYPLAD